jgi:hypothetical protein
VYLIIVAWRGGFLTTFFRIEGCRIDGRLPRASARAFCEALIQGLQELQELHCAPCLMGSLPSFPSSAWERTSSETLLQEGVKSSKNVKSSKSLKRSQSLRMSTNAVGHGPDTNQERIGGNT